MSTLRALALIVLSALPAGCTVSAKSPALENGPSNSCDTDDDCPKGYSCSSEVCQTLNGQLESLLIEVTPTSDSTLPHIPFLTPVEGVPTSGGDQPLSLL